MIENKALNLHRNTDLGARQSRKDCGKDTKFIALNKQVTAKK